MDKVAFRPVGALPGGAESEYASPSAAEIDFASTVFE